jgi:hypothetical protein
MAYSDFTKLKKATQAFGLTVHDKFDLFAQAPTVKPGERLSGYLQDHSSLGLSIGTEKARSEFIVAPILAEARRLTGEQVSLFSGIEFNVDPELELTGVCDFIFSKSPEQVLLVAPALMLVEAKKDDIAGGIGQCIAEMVAAQIFNQREGLPLTTIFGAVTTGSIWKFMKLEEKLVFIDRVEYYLDQMEKILGILLHILQSDQQAQALAA